LRPRNDHENDHFKYRARSKFFYKGRFSKISGISSGFYFVFHEKTSKISKKMSFELGRISNLFLKGVLLDQHSNFGGANS